MRMSASVALVLVTSFWFSDRASGCIPGPPFPATSPGALDLGKAGKGCRVSSPQMANYSRPGSANRLFKTRVAGFRLWASAVIWTPVRTAATQKFDVALDHVADNAQAVLISDKRSVPFSSLPDLALQNAKTNDPNSRITAVEHRIVNGHELVCITYDSTVKTGPTTFYGYFYSDDQGTVEVIAMAPQNLFPVYRTKLTELLNGLEILPPGTPMTEALPGPESARTGGAIEIDPLLVRPGKEPAPNALAQSIRPPLSATANGSGIAGVVSGTGSAAGPAVATAVDSRPIPLNRPRPNYTEDARKELVEGIIRLRALVGANGSVTDIRLVTHLPDGLDEEAILAVKLVQFKPAMKDSQSVAAWVTFEVEFNLCGNCVPRPK